MFNLCSFLSGVFVCVLLSRTNCRVLGFSFVSLVFQVTSIKFELGFQKNNLSSFNLSLIWFEKCGIFSYMRLVLWPQLAALVSLSLFIIPFSRVKEKFETRQIKLKWLSVSF